MSRSVRIEIENGFYHVTSRGGERRGIVADDMSGSAATQLADRYGGDQPGGAKSVQQTQVRATGGSAL